MTVYKHNEVKDVLKVGDLVRGVTRDEGMSRGLCDIIGVQKVTNIEDALFKTDNHFYIYFDEDATLEIVNNVRVGDIYINKDNNECKVIELFHTFFAFHLFDYVMLMAYDDFKKSGFKLKE